MCYYARLVFKLHLVPTFKQSDFTQKSQSLASLGKKTKQNKKPIRRHGHTGVCSCMMGISES
jgi:hypothetical protein